MKRNADNYSRVIIVLILGSIGVVLTSILSVMFGSVNIPLAEVKNAVLHFDGTNLDHQIIHDLRIPRIIGDILVGAALATAGAIMQGMTRNPIADSGLLGINSGAVFALSLCLALFPVINYSIVVAASFGGAAMAAVIVYGLTGLNHGKQSPIRLALAGTAITALFSAVSQTIALYFNVAQEVTFWTVGGVAGIQREQLLAVAPFIVLALVLSVALSSPLSILSLGEEAAIGLGMSIGVVKTLCMLAVLVLSGAAVALAGPITFVGLIIPHIVRRIVGVDYRKIIICSIVIGSLAMLLADLLSKLLNPPRETPIGILFSLIGVPFFIYITRKGGLKGEK